MPGCNTNADANAGAYSNTDSNGHASADTNTGANLFGWNVCLRRQHLDDRHDG